MMENTNFKIRICPLIKVEVSNNTKITTQITKIVEDNNHNNIPNLYPQGSFPRKIGSRLFLRVYKENLTVLKIYKTHSLDRTTSREIS